MGYYRDYQDYNPNKLGQARPSVVSSEAVSFLPKVYGFMTVALILTAVVAYLSMATGATMYLATHPMVFYGALISQFVMILAINFIIQKMPATVAFLMFMLFAACIGLTTSLLLMIYTATSIYQTFAVTAGMFGVMSIFGAVTKINLKPLQSFMMMGLVGIIIASVVNMFMKSPMVYWIVSYLGVFIFVGLIAADTQQIVRMSHELAGQESNVVTKYALMAAINVYLNFINLFMFLLRIMGSRR